MNKIIPTIAIVLATSLGLAACGDEAPVKPKQITELPLENGSRSAFYEREGSPALYIQSSGYVRVDCQPGYHFEVGTQHNERGASFESATCEPNQVASELLPHMPESGMLKK